MEEVYKKLFNEFLDGAIDEESKGRYNSAISNYYKALTTVCSLIIYRNVRNFPLVLNWWLKANLNSDDGKFLSMLKNHDSVLRSATCHQSLTGGF